LLNLLQARNNAMKQKYLLVVEDSKLLYDSLRNKLLEQNFKVAPYTPSVEKALMQIRKKRPDMALLDINLDGERTGIDLGKILTSEYNIPFIYVTELGDDYTFFEALKTKHQDFIEKSVSRDNFKEILRSIYSTLERHKDNKDTGIQPIGLEVLTDYLENQQIAGADQIAKVTLNYKDILYFSLDQFTNEQGKPERPISNYVWLKAKDNKIYFLKTSLSDIYNSLPEYFGRANGQYIVNIYEINGRINASKIKIDDKIIKITDTYKKDFMDRYNKIYLIKK